MTQKAVVYYRSRPSESVASERALLLQRRAVQNAIDEHGYVVIAEFTEREGESGEGRPAYAEAEEAALNEKAFLLVASNAGIGSGTPFRRPFAKGHHGVFHVDLNAQLVPPRQTIALPVGSSADLSLYADYRPSQLDTLIYLCNSGATALSDVVVAIDSISMKEFYEATGDECWAHSFRSESVGSEKIQPGSCELMNVLSHYIWDIVNRYLITFTNATGHRRTVEANDLPFNASRMSQDPQGVWLATADVDTSL
jgi:hypothetical protein